MAWHSMSQAQKMTGKSRRTLYRDMSSGRISYRTNAKGHREIETTELIRAYGEIENDGTQERHTVSQENGTPPDNEMMTEIRALRQEVAELKSMLLRIEHKETAQPETPPSWWKFWSKKAP